MARRLLSVFFLLALPAAAAISKVQSAATWNTTSTTTCTVALTNTTLHNLLVVWATWSPTSVTVLKVVDANNTNPFPSAVGPTAQSASNTAAQIVYQNNIRGTTGTDNVVVTFSGGTATTASCGCPAPCVFCKGRVHASITHRGFPKLIRSSSR